MKLFFALALLLTTDAMAGSLLSSRQFRSVAVTPTISTSAYTANDQVGGIQTIPVVFTPDDTAMLHSLSVVDKASQSAAMIVFFFTSLPTIASTDNAAYDLTDANALLCVGHVAIAAADYKASASNSVASVKNIGLALKSAELSGAVKTGKLYATVMTTGTPTYVSTSDLQFTYSFEE